MPAGWYWLSGRLQVADGMVAAPCLYPSYVGGADGDAQIALPDPDDTGLIRALELFKSGVTSLRFCPVQAPTRFRVEDFSRRRGPRGLALRTMPGAPPSVLGGIIARLLGFGAGRLGKRLSDASRTLYRH